MIGKYKTAKPKLCPCGIRFTPRGIQKYHSPGCELKYKTGNVDSDKLESLDLSVLIQVAKGAFQNGIKKRDEGKPCISCLKVFKKGDIIHAGHCFKAETHSWLLFDEDNCHSQCDTCNIGMDGNFENYIKNLPGRIGVERTEHLRFFAAAKIYTKHDRSELIEIIKKYSK